MNYGVRLVADRDLPEGQEWALYDRGDQLILEVVASCLCARVVSEGMAAMGNLLLRTRCAEPVPVEVVEPARAAC